MFVVDLLLLALSAMVFPDPGMQGVFIHPEVTGGLGNGLIRIDCQFHRTFLACGGVFFHRSLAHRTHLVCCVSSLSPCVRESIATSLRYDIRSGLRRPVRSAKHSSIEYSSTSGV